MPTIRYVLIGLGNLGRRFCEIVQEKDADLRQRYDVDLRLVGAADSRGAAYDLQGLDLADVVRLKTSGESIAAYPAIGKTGWEAKALIEAAEADVMLEASPVNLPQHAEPGLSCIRTALEKGWHVITPNKGPLVVAYQELHALARSHGVKLRYDGTVAGGLPALNIGRRDMRGAIIHRIEAVPNLVTGYVVDMLSNGLTWDTALARARAEGVLESDAAWDLEGWDAAAKLTILANTVLDYPAQIEDVTRAGITGLAQEELVSACDRNFCYRLLARAERRADGGYNLSVAPVALGPDHPLGRLGSKQLGIVFHTDIYGTLTTIIEEPDPIPSAATMLRDLLDIYTED